VAVPPVERSLALGRHGVGRVALDLQARQRDLVDAHARERGTVAVAALGIGVDDVHQLRHGTHTVTRHLRRVAPRCGHHPVAHHQQPVVAAGQVLFHHGLAIFAGHTHRQFQVVSRDDVHRHALALVAVARLHYHRQADVLGHGPGFLGAVHRATQRHRHASGAQQVLGEVLVLRDVLRHRAGAVNLGGPDAPLARAPAELHQRALREAAKWDAARHSRVDDTTGGGTQAHVFVDFAQAGDDRLDIEGFIALATRHGNELPGSLESFATHGLFGVLHHHLIGARLHGFGAAGKAHRTSGLGLKTQRNEFEHVGQRELGRRARPAAELRKALAQRSLEARQGAQ